MAEESVLFISNQDQERLLTMETCIGALEEAFREEKLGWATNRTKASMHVPTTTPNARYRWCGMEGALGHKGIVAVRMYSDMALSQMMEGKRRHEKYCVRPGRYCGLVLLFSTEDAAPLAILNDGYIQHMRVAATHAVATKYLARENARILGILGSGGMAWTHAEAMFKVRQLQKIKTYSPNQEHCQRFASQASRSLGVPVEPMGNPEAVVQGSDMVAACTNSNDPIVLGSWLEEGVHVSSVVAGSQEMDDGALRKVDLYIVYRSPVSEHYFAMPEEKRYPSFGGTTAGLVERECHLIGDDKIHGLGEVLLGETPGRTNSRQITYASSEGTGVQFAALAHRVYQRAREEGMGRKLPLDWFLQDLKT